LTNFVKENKPSVSMAESLRFILGTLIFVVAAYGVALYGEKKKIGFFTAFLVSLLLSPLAGAVCVYFSADKNNQDPKDEFDIEEYRK
jgi:hypothetical protein